MLTNLLLQEFIEQYNHNNIVKLHKNNAIAQV